MNTSIKIKWQPFNLAIHITLFVLSFFHIQIKANEAFTSPPPKNHGLLLLDLDVKADSSMIIRKIGRVSHPIEIKLIANNGRWLIKSLPKGNYQITEIKVPYFDLPYIKHMKKNPNWRFLIQESQLNYAGKIEIAKERTDNYVPIKRYNRLITDLPNLNKELSHLLSIYPLTNGYGMRDDFVENFLKMEKK